MTDIVYNKNGIPFDIDAIATDLNGKMDTDGVNATCPTLLSRTANNYEGVIEIYSDGFYRETGRGNTSGTSGSVTLSNTLKDNTYLVFITCMNGSSPLVISAGNRTTTGFNAYSTTTTGFHYIVEGYIR